MRVHARASQRFDPFFDLSNRTPSSAAVPLSPSQLLPPSSHHVTLILFLPLSCYLVPSHPLFGPNSESAAAASLIKPVNGRHYEICNTPFTEDYWGGSSFTEAGEGGGGGAGFVSKWRVHLQLWPLPPGLSRFTVSTGLQVFGVARILHRLTAQWWTLTLCSHPAVEMPACWSFTCLMKDPDSMQHRENS